MEQRFSSVTAITVPVHRSLLAQLLIAFIGFAISVSVLFALLTALVQHLILEPMLSGDEMRAMHDQTTTGLFIVSFLTILLASVLAYVLARRITRPLRQVMQAMDGLAHEKTDVTLPTRRRDELGALAIFFNSMVKKLRETAERNAGIQRLKSQFIATAAHQMRTPLTGLRWSMHYLVDKGESLKAEEQEKTLRQAAETTDKMMQVVNDLLNVSKVEEGKFGLVLRSVNVTKLMTEIVHEYEPRAKTKKVNLTLKNDIDARLAIVADEDHLRLLFTNLLDNALAYTPTGGRITAEVTLKREFVSIAVTDTGIGIPVEDQPKIFSQFHRAENAKKARTDGSGLGLFIARNIAEQHGGDITFTSKEKAGTTFVVTLPLREELIPKAQTLEDVLTEI